MSASYPPPPPPPPYTPRKIRPSIVTKYALATLILGIVPIIIGILEMYFYTNTAAYAVGAIIIILGAYIIICGVGMLAGQGWSMKISGYTIMSWAKRPEVTAYFELPPAYPPLPPGGQPSPPPAPTTPPTPPASSAAKPTLPPAPTCATCGQPLTYISQYQRWYCENCKKYA